MKRQKLIEALRAVSPALAPHNLVPVMSQFWFTGQRVMAYNDRIALSAFIGSKMKDFVGAVPAEVLPFLQSLGEDEIELKEVGGECIIQAGRSKRSLPMMGKDSFSFFAEQKKQMKINPDAAMDAKGLLTTAMPTCQNSLGVDTSSPELQGITAMPGSPTKLYSTDAKTISMSASPSKLSHRVVLSAHFCKEAINLARSSDEVLLEVRDDCAVLQAGGIMLYGLLIDSGDEPMDFDKLVKPHVPKQPVAVPKADLARVLLAHSATADAKVDQHYTELSVSKGTLRLYSESPRGKAEDKIDFAHPDVEAIKIEPALLSAGLAAFDLMQITDRCIAMTNKKKDLYLISRQD